MKRLPHNKRPQQIRQDILRRLLDARLGQRRNSDVSGRVNQDTGVHTLGTCVF